MFKPGDIVTPLRDMPDGADVEKGNKVLVVSKKEYDNYHTNGYNYYPGIFYYKFEDDFIYYGHEVDFKLVKSKNKSHLPSFL